MKCEYIKIDVEKSDKDIQEQLERIGWELLSVRSSDNGIIYAIFKRLK
jgi:hypothetical protein